MATEVVEDVKIQDSSTKTGGGWLNFSQKRSGIYFLIITLIIMVVVLIILMSVALTIVMKAQFPFQNDSNITGNWDSRLETTTKDYAKENLTLSGKLKLVSRLEWLAQPPTEPAKNLTLPVPYVIIQHTATESCQSQTQCIFHVRYIQTFHIESRNWWDIGYNFLIGGDGEAYEGRGWKSEGAHTYGYNSKSIGIAFIGSFFSMKPPDRQITACKLLIQKGVELGYIKKDYKLLAAKQLQSTQSPGQVLYEELKTWDHWAKTP